MSLRGFVYFNFFFHFICVFYGHWPSQSSLFYRRSGSQGRTDSSRLWAACAGAPQAKSLLVGGQQSLESGRLWHREKAPLLHLEGASRVKGTHLEPRPPARCPRTGLSSAHKPESPVHQHPLFVVFSSSCSEEELTCNSIHTFYFFIY